MRTRRLIRVTMIVIVHELHCPRLPTIAVMHATYHTLRIGHHSLCFLVASARVLNVGVTVTSAGRLVSVQLLAPRRLNYAPCFVSVHRLHYSSGACIAVAR